nr:MAG TPA: hypothetical protein [Caudoviricetes sp.]
MPERRSPTTFPKGRTLSMSFLEREILPIR